MLHLIFQSPFDIPVIERIASFDNVVFMEGSVFQLNKKHVFAQYITKMQLNNIELYVLEDDINTRGVLFEELVSGIEVIDYSELLALTIENKVIRTWN